MEKYDELINSCVETFKKKYVELDNNLLLNYKEYLEKIVIAINDSKLSFVKKDEESIKKLLKYKSDYIMDLPDLDSVKREIVYDKNLETVRMTSIKIFGEALRILRNIPPENEQEFDVEEEMKKIEEAMKYVEPYNMDIAIQYRSEAILDAGFIKNPKTDYGSLRLGREFRQMKYENEKTS